MNWIGGSAQMARDEAKWRSDAQLQRRRATERARTVSERRWHSPPLALGRLLAGRRPFHGHSASRREHERAPSTARWPSPGAARVELELPPHERRDQRQHTDMSAQQEERQTDHSERHRAPSAPISLHGPRAAHALSALTLPGALPRTETQRNDIDMEDELARSPSPAPAARMQPFMPPPYRPPVLPRSKHVTPKLIPYAKPIKPHVRSSEKHAHLPLDLATLEPADAARSKMQATLQRTKEKHHREHSKHRHHHHRSPSHHQSSRDKKLEERERSEKKRKRESSSSPRAAQVAPAGRHPAAAVATPAAASATAPTTHPSASTPANQLDRIRQSSSKMEAYLVALLNQQPNVPLERQMEEALTAEEEFDPNVQYKQIQLTPVKALTIGVSNVSSHTRDTLSTAIATMKGFTLVDAHETGCSHLLMEHPIRTLKLLYAIARGSWVLHPAWLIASLERRKWLSEELFETHHFVACRMSRVNRQQRGPTLFRGLHTLVVPTREGSSEGTSAPGVSSSILEELLYLAGANIVVNTSDAAIVLAHSWSAWTAYEQQMREVGPGSRLRGALAEESKAPSESSAGEKKSAAAPVVVSPEWLYDSLTRFMIMPAGAYTLEKPGQAGAGQITSSPQI